MQQWEASVKTAAPRRSQLLGACVQRTPQPRVERSTSGAAKEPTR
jgi:hypothetical protein